MEAENNMDKYLKLFEPAMKKWLSEHYSPKEAKARWERTVALDEKWILEEGDLGGKKNPMASNMLEAYAFFAFYDSVDRNFSKDDLQLMIDAAMGKSLRMLSHFNMNRLLKHRWIVKLLYRYLDNYRKKAERFRGNAWGNTWKIRLNPDEHEKGLAFVYDTCPLNDFARKHGYIDFLPNLCSIDQITCSAAHGKLIRHKTLADGDGECNYWILGDREPEAIADVGSK